MHKLESLLHIVGLLNDAFLKNAALSDWYQSGQREYRFLKSVGAKLDPSLLKALASEHSMVFRKNMDLDAGFTQIVDSFREKMEKKLKHIMDAKDHNSPSVMPIDAYCGSKRNIKYWEELLGGEDDAAVKDFINYVKKVKCQ